MNSTQLNRDFWQKFNNLITETLVPRFLVNTVRPCTKEDFENYRNKLTDMLNSIDSLLDIVIENENQWTDKTRKDFAEIILIIGEQHCENAWNSQETVEISKKLIPKICLVYKCENLTQVLKNDDIFLSIVMFLRPKLQKDTWKTYPSSVVCYRWILELTEKPLLKQYITDVLPTALIIFDDYVEENQLLGLECISTIIEHCQNSRSLQNFNYDEVIFQALEKCCHKVEPKFIVPLYNCISNLLQNIQCFKDDSNNFGWSKHDDIIKLLLSNMELQTKPDCRYAYIVSLQKLATYSSLGKWTERLTRILSEYCEDINNLKTVESTLDFLKTFLSIYQPKENIFYSTMYSSLLKLRFKLSLCKSDVDEMISKVETCISVLNQLCPNLSKELLSDNFIKSVVNFA